MTADQRPLAQRADRRPITRRRFLRASGLAAAALTGGSSLLAACTGSPRTPPSASAVPAYPLARPKRPVTLPVPTAVRPIDGGLHPEQQATVQLYTWPNYVWRSVLDRFASEFDTSYRIQTFANVAADAAPKLAAGQVVADVFWPTVEYVARMAEAGLLLPLTHSYVPNLRNVWPRLRSPFYDRGSRFTVPYTVWTTGIGYRRDHVDDREIADRGWDLLWDSRFAGRVGIYDDYRDGIALALLRNGVTDLNTWDQAALDAAEADLQRLARSSNVQVTRAGPYARLPTGDLWLHQATSADMVGAQWFLPTGTSTSVLGFWRPETGPVPAGNDAIAIPASATHPVLGHLLLNFLLDPRWGIRNFAWTGCQPPLTALDADAALGRGYVPETLAAAVVSPHDLERGAFELELPPEVDRRWQQAWARFRATL